MRAGATVSCFVWIALTSGMVEGVVDIPNVVEGVVFPTACYGELGCYNTFDCFDLTIRPLSVLPDSRASVDTTFKLYTKADVSNGILVTKNQNALLQAGFNPSRKTKFITHGFIENGDATWIKNMTAALFGIEDLNVFAMDWSKGAASTYEKSCANTWIAGGEMYLFAKYLVDTFNISFASSIHFIGHSLGGQAVGFAGNRTNGTVGRITGLDPAGPMFHGLPPNCRMDPTDGAFVDVIHTNGGVFGDISSVGHFDFYPNGGQLQPGCALLDDLATTIETILSSPSNIADAVHTGVFCSHIKSYGYFTASITNGCFNATAEYPNYQDFTSGINVPCGAGSNCPRLGYYADQTTHDKSTRRLFYLPTTTQPPFCKTVKKVCKIKRRRSL